MSDPIDLDLVELRCRLRGWHCARRLTITGRDELCVTAPAGSAYVIDANGWHRRSDTGAATDEIIYRPRLTLADIVASPPEGWVAVSQEGGAQFHRRNASGHILAIVGWFRGVVTNDYYAVGHGRRQAMKLEERIAIHRAVAELLVLLGEVSP